MESPAVSPSQSSASFKIYKAKISIDAVVIGNMGRRGRDDTSETGINSVFKGLSITAQNVVDKINELLKAKLPNGVQSLKPEDVTPEATATKIVTGVTSLFEGYAKSHPELSGEELLTSFMDKVRSGVQQGYDDAVQTLEGLGAFEFDGVRDGVEETRGLIEEKLQAFESAKRKEMGLDADAAAGVKSDVSSALGTQAGKQISIVA